jgi:hypothetical protein
MLSGSAALGCPAPGVDAVAGVGDESPAAELVPRLSGIVKSAPRTTRRCPLDTVESRAVGSSPSIVARVFAASAAPESG